MSTTRRQFLQGAVASGAALSLGTAPAVQARPNLTLPPKAVGLLYDSTLCIGCKACVSACKESNNLPPEFSTAENLWDTPQDLSGRTKNIIKAYKEGNATQKDREVDGHAFIKHSCLHCVDPSCVSACPVSAMKKDPVTGIVTYDEKDCIGCRYCVVACPFGIPRFEYDKAFPKIVKCELCNHLKPGDKFKYSACAQVCPTGATLYGPVDQLMQEAKRRVALKPGSITRIERGRVGSGDIYEAKLTAQYLPRVYGDRELGGTQVLKISAVPMEKLGMPELPERSFASVSETLQHDLYGWLALPAVVLGGLVIAAKRTARPDDENEA
jgi:Fe-S-cluster-containing dehydrogenase component